MKMRACLGGMTHSVHDRRVSIQQKGRVFFSVSYRSFGAKTGLKMEMTIKGGERRMSKHVDIELGSRGHLILFASVLSPILVNAIDLVRVSKPIFWNVV